MCIERLILHRLLAALVAFVGVSIVIFCIARLLPGDPARIALGPTATDAQVQALHQERHLDQPIVVQYVRYVADVMHGDFGRSLYTNRPVATDIAEFLPRTLELAAASAFLMVAIGLPLGMLGAHFRRRWPDHVFRIVALLAVSTPGFVWAVILQLTLGYVLGLFPIEGQMTHGLGRPPSFTGFLLLDSLLAGDWTAFRDALHHLVLPALALAMSGLGQAARLTRASMGDTYREPYIEMAGAYGFSGRLIATKFAFRPSLTPILTVLGLDFAALLGNAFLVELIFGWPGLSRYGVQVILRKDLDAIVGTVLIISAAFLILNLVVDMLVVLVNPKMRLGALGAR